MDRPRIQRQERVDAERNREHADWLARERRSWLARIAHRGGAPAELVEDIVQAALLDVIRSFPGPDERRSVALYAARCVTSQVIKAKRRFARKESHNRPLPTVVRGDALGTHHDAELEDASAVDPAEAAILRERHAALTALLSELSDEQRAVVFLIAAGFSVAETARALSLSERQVRKRSETGRAKLGRRRHDRGI